jgi:hypothetical protein
MSTVSGHPGTARAAHGPVTVPFWQLMTAGVATALFGVAVLVWPGETLRLLGLLAGVWLIVLGAMRVAGAFRSEAGSTMQHIIDGAFGVLLLLVGFACLRSTGAGVAMLAVLIGLAWLLSGFAELLLGFMSHGRPRVWLSVLGGISLVVGIVFFAWPGISLGALVLLTGVTAIALGVFDIAVAVQARRAMSATPA